MRRGSDLRDERRGAARGAARGFTLLELLIVMTLIGILATIAIPALVQYPIRAKEAVLKTNLKQLRDALEQHYADKGSYPATLEALVPKYLKRLPVDPFTKASTTWVPIFEEEDEEAPGPAPGEGEETESGPGVIDVRSAAPGKSLDGEPYSTW
jgi:general secretion pathway protein G